MAIACSAGQNSVVSNDTSLLQSADWIPVGLTVPPMEASVALMQAGYELTGGSGFSSTTA